MKNLVPLFQRGFSAVRSLYLVALVSLGALLASPAFATPATPVATIKTKIEGAGTDWVEILVVVALVLWGAWAIKLLFRK